MDFLMQLLSTGFFMGIVYGLGAFGFVLIFKATKVFNLAHGHMMMLGAFFAVFFNITLQLPMWLSFLLGITSGAVLGYITYLLAIRPLTGQPLLSVLMVTVGLVFIMQAITTLIWGHKTNTYSSAIIAVPDLKIGNVFISSEYIAGAIIGLIVLTLLIIYFRKTRSGLAMRSIAEDGQLAESMGVTVRKVTGISWVLAGATAAAGGICLAMMMSIDYQFGQVGMMVLPAAVFGGLESLPGAVIGGLVMGIVSNIAGGYLESVLTGFLDIAPYIIMMLVLIFKPYGIFGETRIERI